MEQKYDMIVNLKGKKLVIKKNITKKEAIAFFIKNQVTMENLKMLEVSN